MVLTLHPGSLPSAQSHHPSPRPPWGHAPPETTSPGASTPSLVPKLPPHPIHTSVRTSCAPRARARPPKVWRSALPQRLASLVRAKPPTHRHRAPPCAPHAPAPMHTHATPPHRRTAASPCMPMRAHAPGVALCAAPGARHLGGRRRPGGGHGGSRAAQRSRVRVGRRRRGASVGRPVGRLGSRRLVVAGP